MSRKLWDKRTFKKPRISICVPSGVTEVEKKAVEEATFAAGAREVHLIEEPVAAAIGAGIDISKPCGNMIVDIGGGTADIAVISLGGTVVNTSIKIAGDDFDEAIVRYMRKKHNLLIGERTAEDIKIKIGTDLSARGGGDYGSAGTESCYRASEDSDSDFFGDRGSIERSYKPDCGSSHCSSRTDAAGAVSGYSGPGNCSDRRRRAASRDWKS